MKPDGTVREILMKEANNVKDGNLRDLLPFGFAIHHTGMTHEDRVVEELFVDGSVQVLEKGCRIELSQDVLQGTVRNRDEAMQWLRCMCVFSQST